MGFIPIILFSLAFIFLWGIVNYNSLRKIRNEILQLQESIIEVSLKRKNLATELLSGLSIIEADKENIASIMKIGDNPLIDADNIRQVLGNEVSRTQLSVELNALSQLKEIPRYPSGQINSLIDFTRQLIEMQPRIMDLFHNYQDMVSKPPSRFIARLFGFG